MKKALASLFLVLTLFSLSVSVALGDVPVMELAAQLQKIDGMTFEQGTKGEDVKKYQNALISAGFMTDKADGYYGKSTVAAVQELQAACGLPVTGTADVATQFLTVLYSAEFEQTSNPYLLANANNFAVAVYPDYCVFVGAVGTTGRFWRGTMVYVSGDYYHGGFANNVRNGSGTAHFANGDVYVGDWKNDVMEGTGTYYFGGLDSLERYTGSWAANMMNGWGTYSFPDGRTYAGIWEDNVYKGSEGM